ncbi:MULTISPECIES: respiratory chain complex I subunit 1 family protein [Clostridium]|uniref:Formate hydrogenlyase subunit 4 n=2 Tax=Clostridium TaxID=1485 RepID=A0A151ARF8_9CLOT|nr:MULTISPECIES: complex I subunit 1 family protein [Clostridium]KYH30228.1 formate hydrogenlyase subunit 4 [Clostridium colicanis DSM 13634]MBE6044542.1 NADH-quinone oxidoreductase subunit H [Clostridium thermopalmarium]PRR76725.1 Formate hydrogenlyase subunit 4 [Clostridium thermopalmarium DSM 5974]PVZ23060.1 ech hydrogenase subunit B [Clostridium thermopalmarium DSM 5974]
MIMILKIMTIIIIAPFIGGLITGIDRIISARMQGRQGPPLLQPFYDVIKLLGKESIEVNTVYRFYVYVALIFVIFSSVILLVGGDILIAIFSLTLSSTFFILGGYASNSPYSIIGSQREMLQLMAYEPMVLLTGIGLYYADKSFFVRDIISNKTPAIIYLPGIFLGMLYILTFKLRKSPFDLSMSHHGHQEIVKGITTEYSGRDLAVIEVTHWYETIIAFTLIYLFFATSSTLGRLLAIIPCIAAYILEIIIDNGFARVKWQFALKSTWIIVGILGTVNLVILSIFR